MSESELQRTILHPTVPYVGTIFGGLEPGQMVVVHGSVLPGADRFQIDFQCGCSLRPRADVAFHFNPRFGGSAHLVCNTLQNEIWGWEEKLYQMPFIRGKPFEIIFMIFPDKFQVASNGKHLLVYKHRLNLGRVDTLSISGKVKIDTIGFTANPAPKGSQASSLSVSSLGVNKDEQQECLNFIGFKKKQSSTNCQDSLSFTQQTKLFIEAARVIFIREPHHILCKAWYTSLASFYHEEGGRCVCPVVQMLPYTGSLPVVMGPGKTIAIKGEINKNAKSFSIDLRPSCSMDVALHLNPRMKQKVFVRNTYLFNSWGEEEREVNYFPFSPEMYFEILIRCEAHKFNVAVNGAHLVEYKHRYKDISKINTIAVNGDIQLYDVRAW